MGRVIHFEIPVQDVARAARFYTDVFGWNISEAMPGEYWLIKTGPSSEPGIDGAIVPWEGRRTEGGANAYVCTIAVDNLTIARNKVKRAGGKLTTDVMSVPGIGRFCYCIDTEGNGFGIMQMAGKTPILQQ